MRIGLLTEYPLSHRAGWQSTVRRIREALEKRGHEIVLLHEAPDPHRAWKFLRRLHTFTFTAVRTQRCDDRGSLELCCSCLIFYW